MRERGAIVTNEASVIRAGKLIMLVISNEIDRNTAEYLYTFEIEYLLQEVLNKIKDKFIPHNMFRIQSNDYIICEYYIAFIEYLIRLKTLLDYTNLFSLNDHQKE